MLLQSRARRVRYGRLAVTRAALTRTASHGSTRARTEDAERADRPSALGLAARLRDPALPGHLERRLLLRRGAEGARAGGVQAPERIPPVRPDLAPGNPFPD